MKKILIKKNFFFEYMQFAYVETGQTPEERVAVIKATTDKGISCQDSSLICQILSNLHEIMHLNEAYLTHITDIISKGQFSIKPNTKIFYKNYWMYKIAKYPNR